MKIESKVIDMDKENTLLKDRAWIEINLNNLENNINELKTILNSKTKIIAVIKANAYGHGSFLIAEKLINIGITDFAVATLEEGIELRNQNIKGNILILGYTNIKNLEYVIKYDLIQTIVDYNYSEQIKKINLPQKLKCHVKINTGMNRIGEKFDNIKKLKEIYKNPKLNILGTFSHLCVADSNKKEDINFTKKQITNFNNCIKDLKQSGINVGKLHIQSSYGTINYNEYVYDYVRMGILMYGIYDISSYQKNKLNLKPVLSIKARVTSIKKIKKNESVSYGRTYVANGVKKIASISIGYADGIPRSISNKNNLVKINNCYAPVIGKICMDQCMVDVTDIKGIAVGDIVSIIDCYDNEVSIKNMAIKADTITYELLTGLGNRLPRLKN